MRHHCRYTCTSVLRNGAISTTLLSKYRSWTRVEKEGMGSLEEITRVSKIVDCTRRSESETWTDRSIRAGIGRREKRRAKRPAPLSLLPALANTIRFSGLTTSSRIHVDGSGAIRGAETAGKRRATYDFAYLSIFSPLVISPKGERRAKTRPFVTVVNRTPRPHPDRAIALLMSPPWEISKIWPQRSIWRSWGARSYKV